MSQLLEIDVNKRLVALMEAHDMEVGQTDNYFFVDGLFPGIVAQAFEMERFEHSVVVQIDITMLFPHDSFVESFVAHAGSVEEAIDSIFQQFEANVLHTFIMAFWGKAKKVENGVGSEIWELNGHKWEAIVSNYGYRGYDEFDTIIPEIDAFYDTIKSTIEAYPVEKDIYAIRSVFTNTSTGEQVTEALINNEEFPELHAAIADLPWNPSDQFYSVRNLVLLMKLSDDAEERMDKNEVQL